MPSFPPPDPWTGFASRVFEVNGLIIAAGEDIARKVGQTAARWRVLGRLHHPRTVPDLAREIGIARQAVQRTADALIREGLVITGPHPEDQRTRLLSLSAEGHAVVHDLYREQCAWMAGVIGLLDESRLTRSADDLAAVARVLRHDDSGDRIDRNESS